MKKAAEILQAPLLESFSSDSPNYKGKYIPSLDRFPLSPKSTMGESLIYTVEIESLILIFIAALLIRMLCITNADLGLNVEVCLLWTYILQSVQNKQSPDSQLVKIYSDFYSTLQKEGLLDRIHEKVLLDGKEVLKLLNIKPGKDVQIILKRIEAWQFDRDIPEGKREEAKEECKKWLVQECSKGTILPSKV